MRNRHWIMPTLLLPLLLGTILAAQKAATPARNSGGPDAGERPLSPAQVDALMARAVQNQHKDDRALENYARIEREVDHNTRDPKGPTVVTIFRIVPNGTGESRIAIERNGTPTDPAAIAEACQGATEAVVLHSKPDDTRTKQDREKAERQDRERAELEDAIPKAFHFQATGHTGGDQHNLVEIAFEPDPNFRSSVHYANLFTHIRGSFWVDTTRGHVTKLQAQLIDDIPFYGLLARIYRGGSVTIDQTEVDPDVWLPTRITYDFEYRKIVFLAAFHEHVEISQYRRVGDEPAAIGEICRERPSIPVKDP
jgi:hypothetical protein